jgi:copper homeostasis protein
MKSYFFELCAESLNAAQMAERGGADRIELCSQLDIGGVTPGKELAKNVIDALSIPVHVLIRPRGGSFVYTSEEFEEAREQVRWVKQAGAAGAVLGVLRPDHRIDVERNRELIELARPMSVTFHRAFDRAPDLSEALETVIELGVDCQLTSANAPNVLAGSEALGNLVKQANGRINIMAGGGLKLASLAELLQRTGLRSLHGSLLRNSGRIGKAELSAADAEILLADVRTAVRLMHEHFSATNQLVS